MMGFSNTLTSPMEPSISYSLHGKPNLVLTVLHMGHRVSCFSIKIPNIESPGWTGVVLADWTSFRDAEDTNCHFCKGLNPLLCRTLETNQLPIPELTYSSLMSPLATEEKTQSQGYWLVLLFQPKLFGWKNWAPQGGELQLLEVFKPRQAGGLGEALGFMFWSDELGKLLILQSWRTL